MTPGEEKSLKRLLGERRWQQQNKEQEMWEQEFSEKRRKEEEMWKKKVDDTMRQHFCFFKMGVSYSLPPI